MDEQQAFKKSETWNAFQRPCNGFRTLYRYYWLFEQTSTELGLPTHPSTPFTVSDIGRLLRHENGWLCFQNDADVQRVIDERYRYWVSLVGLRNVHPCSRINGLTCMLGQRSELLDVLALLSRVYSGLLRVDGDFNWYEILNPYHPEDNSVGKYLRSTHWTINVYKGVTL